jgi:hemolysin III
MEGMLRDGVQAPARPKKLRRRLTDTLEEIVNVVTHGAGLVASVALLPVFVFMAARAGDTPIVIGVAIFGLTLIGAYAASTMYHSRRPGPNRDLWRRLDQSAVYLLIAGTYTPFALGALRGPFGWLLLSVVWAAALTGIVIKAGLRIEAPKLETIAYLAMGWLVTAAAKPLIDRIGWAGMGWIMAGGVFYTLGVIFLVNQKKWRYGHNVWHLTVLGGSACHAIAVVNYGMTLP